MTKEKQTPTLFSFSFGDDFLRHHAGQIVTDQTFAIIELLANCWDAGSTNVDIHGQIMEGNYLYQIMGLV